MPDADGELVAVPRRSIRRLTLLGIAAVGLLNIADDITTHLLLSHRAVEANPLASVLLSSGSLLWVKLTVVVLAALVALRIPPKVGVLLLAWFVAGVYAAAVLSNALILRLV